MPVARKETNNFECQRFLSWKWIGFVHVLFIYLQTKQLHNIIIQNALCNNILSSSTNDLENMILVIFLKRKGTYAEARGTCINSAKNCTP